jgi:hypothetical protein
MLESGGTPLLRTSLLLVWLGLLATVGGVAGVARAQASDGLDTGIAPPRVPILAAANSAYQQGDLASAIGLYEQVSATPPGQGETPAESAAIDGLAGFRETVILVVAGRDDDARQQLTTLQERDPNGPLTRLAAQFWDQYGMTALPRAACFQLAPQVASQAGAALEILGTLGASVDADTLCTVPTS